MSDDVRPYGYLENATDQGVTADALVGERAGNVTAHQGNPDFAPATGYSTAPYIPPKPPAPPPPAAKPEPVLTAEPACGYKNCKQPRVDGTEYCERHTLF